MFNKSFKDISDSDLMELISIGVTEGQNLEFKREVWGRSDDDVREMLRDISCFSNAYGGHIIIGMDEEPFTGKALSLTPILDAGTERDRIYASSMANLQPRIMGLEIKNIETGPDKNVLVIKIPAGNTLHQITFKGMYQFWIRHDRQKNKMSYDEIRDVILRNNVSTKETEKLFDERRRALEGLHRALVISVAPIKLESELFKINNQEIRELLKSQPPQRLGGWGFNFPYQQVRPSLNGLSVGDGMRVVELYRNGYMEGVMKMEQQWVWQKKVISHISPNEIDIFRNWAIVESVYNFFCKLEVIMKNIGYDAPFVVKVSLFGIFGMYLPKHSESASFERDYEIAPDNSIEIGPMIFESLNSKLIAKELCDRLWQAFHFENEPYFIDGNFQF